MIDDLIRMIVAREEIGATHTRYAQRVIRPLMVDETGSAVLCASFSGSDRKYRLERLVDGDLRPFLRAGWNVHRRDRPVPDLAAEANMIACYSTGIMEILVVAWAFEVPVTFPYRKADGNERAVRAITTWAADEHGKGEVFGVIDLDRKAPRTYRHDPIARMTMQPALGQRLPVWTPGTGWTSTSPPTWGALAKAAAGAR